MAGLMTTTTAARRGKHLEISAWILSGNSHADQPAERRFEGGNHFWNRTDIADIGDKEDGCGELIAFDKEALKIIHAANEGQAVRQLDIIEDPRNNHTCNIVKNGIAEPGTIH